MAELSGQTQFRFEPKIQHIMDRVLESQGIAPSVRERMISIVEPMLVKRDWEIEDALSSAMVSQGASFPYIVVADDGSGDYTSIKDAVDAVPASVNYFTYIYVKPSTTGAYTDSTGPTDISNKRIQIFCPHPGLANGTQIGPSPTTSKMQVWNLVGFTSTSGGTYLVIEGLVINGTDSPRAVFRASSTFQLWLRHCATSGGLLCSGAFSGGVVFLEYVNVHTGINFVNGAGTFAGTFIAYKSVFAYLGQTESGVHIVTDCWVQTDVTGPAFTGEARLINNRWGAEGANTTPTLTFWSTPVEFRGNTSLSNSTTISGNTSTVTINCAPNGTCVFDDNAMPFVQLVVVGDTSSSLSISGQYATIDLSANVFRGVFNLALRGSNLNGGVVLNVAGSYNVINATVQGTGATEKGYTFTAASARNIAHVAGSSTLAGASADAGTANSIVAT